MVEMCMLFFAMIRETAFPGKGERKQMFAMKSEEQNFCNEKGKNKFFRLKEGTMKCSKWKGKE